VRKSGLAKPDMTDGEKAAEKYRQEAAAARELGKASLAAAKDKLARGLLCVVRRSAS